jgi:hypothetical protein
MTDATFRIVSPYILEILHGIFANESIPIAIAVFPTETDRSYEMIYSHIIEVLQAAGLDQKLLLELPLVSDQGGALQSLVRHYGLTWLLCHRHLIEKAGSYSQVGDWVARILRCATLEELERVAACILAEIGEIEANLPNRRQ